MDLGTGVGQLNLYIQINSIWKKTFDFRTYDSTTGVYTDENLQDATFTFFLKKFKGDRLKVLNLTLNNGIEFVTYYDNRIQITISAAQSQLEEGEYYWELRRSDLDRAKLSGFAYLTYDARP